MAYNYNFNTQTPQQSPNTQSPQQFQGMQMLPQQNIQPLFPQPQGNVYNINSTLEVANVPVGAGISVALCMQEGLMYIKTMQNGNPLFYPYKIVPFNSNDNSGNNNTNNNVKSPEPSEQVPVEKLMEQLKDCNERIAILEEQIIKMNKKGSDWKV